MEPQHIVATRIMATDISILELLEKQSQILARLTSASSINKEQLMDKLSNSIAEFSYDPTNSITFNSWYNRHEDIFLIDGKDLEDPARVRLLMRKLNTVAYGKYSAYILPKNPRDLTFAESVKILKGMFGIQESQFSVRYKCLQTIKNPQEDLVSYAARVNECCERFDLSHMNADQFKCLVFVCGLQSHTDVEIRMKSLSVLEDDSNQTVDKLVTSAQRLINLRRDTAMVEDNTTTTVNAIKSKSNFRKTKQDDSKTVPKTPCWNCGSMHFSKYCNFINHKCSQCNVVGHKEGYCKTYNQNNQNRRNGLSHKKKNKYHKNAGSPQTNVVQINKLSHVSRRKYVNVNIKSFPLTQNDPGCDVKLQIDTASDVSMIGKSLWDKMGNPGKQFKNRYVTSASNNKIKLLAEFDCQVRLKGEVQNCSLSVVEIDTLSIFGTDWCDIFRIWDQPLNAICCQIKEAVISPDILPKIRMDFADIFQDTPAKCIKAQVQLHLKSDSKPIFRAKRPVAYSMLPHIEDELNRLESLGIISPVDFSDWAAPIVAVKKPNGKIRICGDYSSGLNDCLEPHKYPLHRPEDLYTKVANSCLFTHIDLSDAYLQTEVTSDSAKLLTINTHKGLYTFNRLAPGVKSAPGAFQQIMDAMLTGVDDAAAYIDDIIIGGSTVEKHLENVNKVLQKLREFNFHIKFEKCRFFVKEVKYLGNIISQHGLRPDPDKIKTILDLPAPTDTSQVRSYLGSINYYGKYINQMSKLRAPLDNLLKNDTKFEWTAACQKTFQRFKEILSSDLMLTHYNPDLPIKVAADASGKGLGAFICHIFPDKSEKVIAHASRTLTPAEKNYSQIEKEGLALIYAVKKFHRYIYGRQFILCTDHKPLLSIFGSKSGIPAYAANRLQRWALTLMMYDFKINYVNTKEFGCVDVLSRLIDTNMKPDEDIIIACATLEDDCSSALSDHFNNLPITFNMVLNATNKCKVLQTVIASSKNGWEKKIPPELTPYFVRRDQLYVVQGCLMFNDRIVIPPKFRNSILKELHRGHPGKERMKSLARSHVYWPGIDVDIVNYVRNCHQCAVTSTAPVKHTLQSWPLTKKPMERIHIDIAGPCNGLYYFVIVDSFSKWPEIFEISNISSATIISKLTEMFARYGDPDTIVSDNGTQFVSAQFSKFVTERGIAHMRTAPYHPQSNGQAERFVGTLKRALAKLKNEGTSKENLETFLQTYRSTPRMDSMSPAELFLNRKIKTTLDLLKPQKGSSPKERNVKQEEMFNKKHGARAKHFDANEEIYAQIFRNNKYLWVPGVIIERVGTVNYNVLVFDKNKKKLLRSHANQIKKRYNSDTDQTESTHLFLEMFDLYKNQDNARGNQEIEETNQCDNFELNAVPELPPHSTSQIEPDPSSETEHDASFHSTSDVVEIEEGLLDPPTTSATERPSTARPPRNRKAPSWMKDYHVS